MTKDTTTPAKDEKDKKVKKSGPIRLEAIIPTAIVFGLIASYFMLFFDMHLRHGIEYGATLANGAEVNVGHLSTSFLGASFNIGNIEVTDAKEPTKNIIQIGEIKFGMLVDALLRGKIVINDASILDIGLNTNRKKPGKVIPPPPPKTGPGIGDKSLSKLQKAYSHNVLGDIAAFAQGADPEKQLAELKMDLKTTARITELENELNTKKQEWQKRMDAMPAESRIPELRKQLNDIKIDNNQTPVQIVATLRELNSIRKELQGYSAAITDGANAIGDDSKKFRSSITDLEGFIKKDVSALKEHFHIPKLDARSLSGVLFGDTIIGTLLQAEHYVNMARSYMPPKTNEKEKKIEKPVPAKRSAGINYSFGHPNSYPKFWLRKAKISSSKAGEISDLSGEIRDFTSSPAELGKPLIILLQGSLPDLKNVRAEIMIDHTTSTPLEQLKLTFASFTVKDKTLTKSTDAELGIASANGSSSFTLATKGDKISIHSTNTFSDVNFKSSAKTELIKDVMNSTLSGIKTVTMDASGKGTWDNLDLHISSNLGTALEKGFSKYLKDKFSGIEKKIEELVKSKVSDAQKALLKDYSSTDSIFKDKIKSRQKQIDSLEKEITDRISQVEKQKSSANPVNKVKSDVLNKIKSPF